MLVELYEGFNTMCNGFAAVISPVVISMNGCWLLLPLPPPRVYLPVSYPSHDGKRESRSQGVTRAPPDKDLPGADSCRTN